MTLNEPLHLISIVCMLNLFSCVQLFVTLWTVAHQSPLSMGFSIQEYCSGLPFLPPGDLPNWRMELESIMFPALTGRFFTTSTTWEALISLNNNKSNRFYFTFSYSYFILLLSFFFFFPQEPMQNSPINSIFLESLLIIVDSWHYSIFLTWILIQQCQWVLYNIMQTLNSQTT